MASTPPTGTIHDGNNRSFNVILGSSIADGRGNVTGYAGYPAGQSDPERQPRLRRLPAQRQARTPPGMRLREHSARARAIRTIFKVGTGPTLSVLGNQFVPRGSAATTPPVVSSDYIYNGRDDCADTAASWHKLIAPAPRASGRCRP